jgi:predicted nucleotide-binding protein (sugar kinase/HSP70/actin superfamily)
MTARVLPEHPSVAATITHFRRPAERPFTRAERDTTTIWFGGVTLRHEQLILAGLEGLGYRAGIIATPAKADFQAGKEYGNNGQCNPTYFTVGALVNHLKHLRDVEGIPVQRIIDEHVFLTAGACGPCRFGMYEAEFRLALRNAGFDGFRVILFQQTQGLTQDTLEAGLELNVNFFVTILNAFLIGDLLNEVAYQLRPYEMDAGATNRALEKCISICANAIRAKDYEHVHPGVLATALGQLPLVDGPAAAATFLDQLRGTHYTVALQQCLAIIQDEVRVDLLRPRPICKVTGEFWAQTTEGDGNFRMFAFLEREGAEVLVEPIATWIAYLLAQATDKIRDRASLEPATGFGGRLAAAWQAQQRVGRFRVAQMVLTREYDRYRAALGGTTHALVDQPELQRLGHPYYNSRSGGGEGHLEVAKAIYYTNRDLCHMVLSLKPFGCMPSTQSDGAQAAVTSHFPQMIYIPIETSGEGDINAYSRVQMALGEAKQRCKEEFSAAVAATGYSLESLREFVAARPALQRALTPVPRTAGVVGSAATFALHVGGLMRVAGVPPTALSNLDTARSERTTSTVTA